MERKIHIDVQKPTELTQIQNLLENIDQIQDNKLKDALQHLLNMVVQFSSDKYFQIENLMFKKLVSIYQKQQDQEISALCLSILVNSTTKMNRNMQNEHFQLLFISLMIAIQSPIREISATGATSIIKIIKSNFKFRNFISQRSIFIQKSADILKSGSQLQFQIQSPKEAYSIHTKLAVIDILNQLLKFFDIEFDEQEIMNLIEALQTDQYVISEKKKKKEDDTDLLKDNAEQLLSVIKHQFKQQFGKVQQVNEQKKQGTKSMQSDYKHIIKMKRILSVIYFIIIIIIIASICVIGFKYYKQMKIINDEVTIVKQDKIKAEQELQSVLQQIQDEKDKLSKKKKNKGK